MTADWGLSTNWQSAINPQPPNNRQSSNRQLSFNPKSAINESEIVDCRLVDRLVRLAVLRDDREDLVEVVAENVRHIRIELRAAAAAQDDQRSFLSASIPSRADSGLCPSASTSA